MTLYACKTRDTQGVVIKKTIVADSKQEVQRQLQDRGLFAIQIREQRQVGGSSKSTSTGPSILGRRVSGQEILRLTWQLGSSIAAGVPILTALESIQEQTSDVALKAVLGEMCSDVEGGMSLSSAMASHPRAFSTVYVNTVAAGERTGSLEQLLDNLADFQEADLEARADVRSALIYPAIVIGVLCLAVSVLMIFVVPRFAAFYTGFGADLPLPTRMLIGFSTALTEYLMPVLAGVALCGYGLTRFLRSSPGKRQADRLMLRLPVIGSVIKISILLRVVQMLGLFSQAGLPVLNGLEIIAGATNNTRYRQALRKAAADVAAGESLSESLKETGTFPPAFRQMIATGESSGSLEKSCLTMALQYKKQLRYLTKNLAILIEPLLTLVLAGIVLFVALATFLPMWDLVKVIRK